MKKKILTVAVILLILAGGISSCGKEKEENQILDLGMYIETHPFEGRTQINFIDKEKLAIIKGNGDKNDTVFYEIIEIENTIRFFQIEDRSESGGYFKIINRFKFEISNLYFAPAYGAPIIMTFEKKNMLTGIK